MEFVENLIKQVSNPYSKQQFKSRYVRIITVAKKVPNDRALSYSVFRNMLMNMCEHAVEYEAKGREELQMMENLGFIVPHENITEEEIKKMEEEKKAKKADWLKKTKKKPKTEEEENAELEELKHRVINGMKADLINNRVAKAEKDVEIIKTKWLMDNHIKMDAAQYDELYRLESVLDSDFSGKDVILRLDLDVPLSPYVPPPPQPQG